jgi:hypothetical protein
VEKGCSWPNIRIDLAAENVDLLSSAKGQNEGISIGVSFRALKNTRLNAIQVFRARFDHV